MSIPSIITQVSRDEESVINSPRRTVSVHNDQNKKKKKGFFSRLFSCCTQASESDDNYSSAPAPSSSGGGGSGSGGGVGSGGSGTALLGPPRPEDVGKKCLILDLDETLVHSSFKPVPNADFVVPVEIRDKYIKYMS